MQRIEVYKNFYSDNLKNYRDIIVYLPKSYYESDKEYPVIYFHDGMEVFFKEWSLSKFSWEVQTTIDNLIDNEKIPEVICVGISNNYDRFSEYSHFYFTTSGFDVKCEAKGEKYENFVLNEVIPSINKIYRTNDEKYMVGSSMGGLVTLLTAVRNQDVFKGIVAMSSYLNIDNCKPVDYIKQCDFKNMPKIYLDYGAKEDKNLYELPNVALKKVLLEKGLKENTDFMFKVDIDGIHSEECWAKRLPYALEYLFK